MDFADAYLMCKLGRPELAGWWGKLLGGKERTFYAIAPKQSGAGDPSPDNVRPILPGLRLIMDDSSTLEVYGGTLTVTSGVLTVTHRCVSFDGTENWGVVNNSDNIRYFVSAATDGNCVIGSDIYSHTVYNPNIRTPASSASVQYGAKLYEVNVSGLIRMILCLPDMPGTAADFKAMLAAWAQAGTPLQVCYELAEPVTYQLTPQEVERAVRELST